MCVTIPEDCPQVCPGINCGPGMTECAGMAYGNGGYPDMYRVTHQVVPNLLLAS